VSTAALEALVQVWDSEDVDVEARILGQRQLYGSMLRQIRFHADHRYWHFAPTYFGGPDFYDRLYAWLSNPDLSTEQQQLLFRLVLELNFVDRDDILALYRSAYTGPIVRWLIDSVGVQFDGQGDVETAVRDAAGKTWFCGVTDSMDIAQFHHVNHLVGHDQRPAWRALRRFGAPERISDYIERRGIRRVVLLEDYVGSGTQAAGPVKFAVDSLCPKVPVLFVPLLCSEVGAKRFSGMEGDGTGFTFAPLYLVSERMHLRREAIAEEAAVYGDIRGVVMETFAAVRQPFPPEDTAIEDAFGFGGVGSLVVLYSNCPNNTLPLVWHEAPRWKPLFARVARA